MTSRSEGDGWTSRLAHLAALARVDGLAIVLGTQGAPSTYAAHGLDGVDWSHTAAAATIMNVLTQHAPAQLGAAGISLADGRTADALAAVPIVWKDQLVGVLVAVSTRALSADDETSLAHVADVVGIDLAGANMTYRAQRQVMDFEARLRVFRDMQRSVRERDLGMLLERATNQIADLYAADGVSIMLVDDEGRLAVRAARGLSDEARRERRTVGDGIAGGVALNGEPRLVIGAIAGGTDATAREAMAVPLRVGDRIIGVVNVKHRAPQQRYTQTQLDSLGGTAQTLANAIATVNELVQAEADRQQAIVLYELSRFAALGTDPQSDLASATAMLAGTLRHDAVGVWQIENDRLRLRASAGYDGGSEIALDEADTTLATVVREKHTARERLGVAEERPAWAAPGCTQFVLAPIGSLGVLILGRSTAAYTDAESEFSATVADYLAGMLQRSSAQDVVDRGIATERRRIAQEIHDGLAQELTGVVLALEGCQRAFEKDPTLLGPQLQKAARDARATLADVRQYMAALRQSETGALNLPVTLGRLVDDLRRQTGLHVEMDESGSQRELEPIVERAVIRIVGEALRNVAQHASASHAKVALQYGAEGVVVTIEDDGRGFDVEHTFSSAEARGHFGVVGMRERAEAAGGQLVVRSEAGHGTIVRSSIPYTNLAAVPGLPGPIEDVEQQPVEDQDTGERGGFFTRLFGR
ncbi:MAG TPA: GAF domain-containing protein [Candidatus Limnocylindria bacterium]